MRVEAIGLGCCAGGARVGQGRPLSRLSVEISRRAGLTVVQLFDRMWRWGTVSDELDAAIITLLDVDPHDLSDDDLDDAVVAIQRQSSRLAAVRARLISAWDHRHIWATDGSRSPAARLARDASIAPNTAGAEVRRARALRTMPHTAAALAEGALSPDHVDLLACVDSGSRTVVFADHEETLVAQCKLLRFSDACRMVAYWRQRADAAIIEDEGQRLHEGRTASAATTFEGVVDLRALFDPLGGAEFLTELQRLEHLEYLADLQPDAPSRTPGQRRLDALVEMARRSRSAHHGGLRPRPLLTVLVGEQTLARLCELATGTVIAPGLIVPLLSDADIERVVFDGPDRVIAVSHKRRFTGALRRAIEVRDRRCQHPSGCDEPAATCDVDHVVPHSEGGITSHDNGELKCHAHNRDESKRNAQPKPTNERQPPDPEPDPPPDDS